MNFDVFEYTTEGGREYNEDSVGFTYDESGGIFVAADGLGGHKYGEKASDAAVEAITNDWSLMTEENISEQLKKSIIKANNNILDIQNEIKAVTKTTVVAVAIKDKKAYWANVGDSRVYCIHNNELYSVTNDHSVAFKKFKAFEITRDEIGKDEDQSSLLRSLGGKERFDPEIYCADFEITPGDAFYLCTDGAWEYLKDEEIAIDFLKSKNARHWAELTLIRIMKRISRKNDNLSILTVITE